MSVEVNGTLNPYWESVMDEDAGSEITRNSVDNGNGILAIGGFVNGVVLMYPTNWENVDTFTYNIFGAVALDGSGSILLETGTLTEATPKMLKFGFDADLDFTPMPFIYVELVAAMTTPDTATTANTTVYILYES